MGIRSVTQGTQLGLCDNPEGWAGVGGGRRLKREWTHVSLWQVCVDVPQKPTQYCNYPSIKNKEMFLKVYMGVETFSLVLGLF